MRERSCRSYIMWLCKAEVDGDGQDALEANRRVSPLLHRLNRRLRKCFVGRLQYADVAYGAVRIDDGVEHDLPRDARRLHYRRVNRLHPPDERHIATGAKTDRTCTRLARTDDTRGSDCLRGGL